MSNNNKNNNKKPEEAANAQISMLQSMFSKNADILTPSTLKEVVKENAGDLDKCVGTFSARRQNENQPPLFFSFSFSAQTRFSTS